MEPADKLIGKAEECVRSGDLRGAVAAYRSYLDERPNDADAHACLGDLYARDGLEDDAVLSYENALTYEPEHFRAYVGIANVLTRKGWPHAAIVVLEAMERMRPNDPAAHDEVVRARAAIQIGRAHV